MRLQETASPRAIRPRQRTERMLGMLGALLLLAMPCKVLAGAADPMTELLEMMTQKGMLTEAESQKVKAAAEALRNEAAQNPAPRYSKSWKGFDSVKNLEVFGDLRIRYEARDLDTPGGAKLDVSRYRYAFRGGIRGELFDDFNFGLRLDTGSNPRSPWVTFGTSSSGVPYFGPFGKSTASLALSQIYLGWHPKPWVEVTAGKMPNPLYTTAMVWDPDLNPEGLAQRFKATVGQADLFANFGQFIYQDVNPVKSTPFLVPTIPFGKTANTPFLLAWQAGVNYHINTNISFKVAPTLYNYTGHGGNIIPGGAPALPGFGDYFVGEGSGLPVNGASGYPLGVNGGFDFNQTGINNLMVLDIPFEVNFKISKLNVKVFGDYAQNLNGADRAASAVLSGLTNNPALLVAIPLQKNDNKAYQFGFGIGNGENLGLVYGQNVKKGTWEVRTYWQHIEQYALDPNLMDSDFFEGRANMKGLYSAFAYSFSDSVVGTVRYGFGSRINPKLGTGGANLDAPQINPINRYHILQVDLSYKF